MTSYDNYRKQHHVIWLEIESSSDNDDVKRRLFDMLSTFEVYHEPNNCIDFILNLPADKTNVFLILVGNQSEYLVELIWKLEHIRFIYLFNRNEEQASASDRINVRFSTKNWQDLFISLTRDIELIQDFLPPISIFTYTSDTPERSLRDLCSDQQSATFVWFQLLVDVIRELPQSLKDKEEMVEFCRSYFHDNVVEQRNIDEFLGKYQPKEAVQWYTKPGFLFQLLNRAFRTQNIDNIFKVRYFLQGLYKQLMNEYTEQRSWMDSIKVYRGQIMYKDDFDTILKSSVAGSLIAFNSFLSTTLDEDTARIFAGSGSNISDEEKRILFTITLDFVNSKNPLVSITHLSHVKAENEILVAMGSVFKIDQIVEDKQDGLWHVNLTLNNEVNDKLSSMINYLKQEMGEQPTLMTLGCFLGDMGEFNKAKGYFQLLLSSLSFDHPDFGTIYNNLGILAHKQNQHKKAIDLFKQALEVLPEHHGDQASVYTNLGACYQALENYNDALNAYKKALEVNIFRGDKAKVYNNIGSIYRNLGQYEKSLKYYRKSLQLRHPDDPEYVALHINLALLYAQNWDYPNTLIHCQKSLESIQILPTDSILIGNTHLNIGHIKAKIEQHSEAIAHFTDALFAYRQMTRSPLVTNAIVRALYEQGRSYMELDQDTNAFACFNEIFSLVFDDEHSQIHVALTHQSIGQIHESKGAFHHALLSYEKALQIWMILLEKNIKVDQHVIAQLLNDIGEVHHRKRRYWLALNYYNQAIEFAQGNEQLIVVYKENFRQAAKMTQHIIQRIPNVDFV